MPSEPPAPHGTHGTHGSERQGAVPPAGSTGVEQRTRRRVVGLDVAVGPGRFDEEDEQAVLALPHTMFRAALPQTMFDPHTMLEPHTMLAAAA